MKNLTSKEVRDILKISKPTLRKYALEGKIKATKLSPRKYLYDITDLLSATNTEDSGKMNVIYARVSTSNQAKDLDNQIETVKGYMLSNGSKIDKIYSDIASGLNENRTGLNSLIKDVKEGKINKVYVTFKDRLTRFGFGYFEYLFGLYGVDIEVLDSTSEEGKGKNSEQEITDDLISIIHHYSMKLYSNRRKKLNEINRIIKE